MSGSLCINVLNGLSGDPAVCVSLSQLGESVLFDAGDLRSVSHRDLLKIRTICISHTHIDHFIGFDQILRVNVPHFRTLEVIGPMGIIENVTGKIRGYTWNLLEDDQVNIIVHEVDKDLGVRSVKLTNTNNFAPTPLPNTKQVSIQKTNDVFEIPLSHTNYRITACLLDHGIPVCAYSLQMPEQQHVSKQALIQGSYEPGPWLSELQKRVSKGDLSGHIDVGSGRAAAIKDLAKLLITRKAGEKISYVTDVVFSKQNVDTFKCMAIGSDTLICEANYREEHRDRAFAKKHLTTRQAALIAMAIASKELKIFHVSAIYGNSPEESERESLAYFDSFKDTPVSQQLLLIQNETKG